MMPSLNCYPKSLTNTLFFKNEVDWSLLVYGWTLQASLFENLEKKENRLTERHTDGQKLPIRSPRQRLEMKCISTK